jgi:hypothetical protein
MEPGSAYADLAARVRRRPLVRDTRVGAVEAPTIASSSPSGPREGHRLAAQGNPRIVLRRAIERDNLVAAELNAQITGNVTLVEALELTALVAVRDPPRRSR